MIDYKKRLFPVDYTCSICQAEKFDDGVLCEKCKKDIVFNNGYVCQKCGKASDESVLRCPTCIGMDTKFDCSGYKIVDGEKIKCWRSYSPHGEQSLYEAYGNSCN
ncbi:MAG: double zinc ribbon domain-containing protein, partial [Clostridia bacterium]|nr:double zinc ribbon domain-containing protein [Clostridia bacterium]